MVSPPRHSLALITSHLATYLPLNGATVHVTTPLSLASTKSECATMIICLASFLDLLLLEKKMWHNSERSNLLGSLMYQSAGVWMFPDSTEYVGLHIVQKCEGKEYIIAKQMGVFWLLEHSLFSLWNSVVGLLCWPSKSCTWTSNANASFACYSLTMKKVK